jgi:hypothetical protein
MQRNFNAVLVVLAGMVLPVCAQRADGTGQRGGVEGYSGPAYSSYAAVGRSGVLSTAQYGSSSTPQSGATAYARGSSNQSSFVRPNLVADLGRHRLDNRSDDDHFERDRDDHGPAPYLPLYGVVTLFSTGYLGSFNPGFYVDLANPAPPTSLAPLGTEYDEVPARQVAHRGNSSQTTPAAEYYPTSDGQTAAAPPSSFRPAYQRHLSAPELGTEAAVTLVFKDGRPTEQINNYMLTRKTLFVQEQRLREIPVDQLDLAATEKVNQEVGVDFHLPGTSR